MASGIDDTSNCPVCLNEFEETGATVPLLLPCSHTVCTTCASTLKNNGRLVCPQCRATHESSKKTFPENRYIIKMIQSKRAYEAAYEKKLEDEVRKVQKLKFELCPDHKLEKVLFCYNWKCNKPICTTCLLGEHRTHDVVDRVQDQIKKSQELTARIDTMCLEFHEEQKNILFCINSLDVKFECCGDKIRQSKEVELIRIGQFFDCLMKQNTLTWMTTSHEMEKYISDIKDATEQLRNIRDRTDQTKTKDELDLIKNEIDLIELNTEHYIQQKRVQKRVHEYFSFQEPHNPVRQLETVFGNLESKYMSEENGGQ